ncbi:site-specific integrase [Thermoanaerobacteraceae bacterium SP2]|nr:site-specific integrase [Thermoanaerobacteraceae bacterium SP2]
MPKVVKITRDTPATWQEALQQFLWWKQAQGISATTLGDYRQHITRFFNRYPTAYSQTGLKPCVLEYMAQPVKPATFNLRLVYLKAFFDWCVHEGIFFENPLEGFKQRKADARIIDIDTEVLKKLLEIPDQTTFAGLRDYALLVLELDTGIRPKEALQLLISDFDFRNLEVTVRAEISKTRTARTLPLMPQTCEAVRKLISARHPSWKDDVPVFCSSEGTMMSRFTWRDRLKMYGQKLGVKLTPYSLRHLYAINYLRNGGYELGLMRTMGHTTLSMTKRYVNFSNEDLHRMNSAVSPINALLPRKNHRKRKV